MTFFGLFFEFLKSEFLFHYFLKYIMLTGSFYDLNIFIWQTHFLPEFTANCLFWSQTEKKQVSQSSAAAIKTLLHLFTVIFFEVSIPPYFSWNLDGQIFRPLPNSLQRLFSLDKTQKPSRWSRLPNLSSQYFMIKTTIQALHRKWSGKHTKTDLKSSIQIHI